MLDRAEDRLEFGPQERIREQQQALLRQHLRYLQSHSAFYRRRFAAAGLTVAAVRDISELPLTDKADLEEYNRDFLCVPQEEIVDLCLTSGTTGAPVPLLQTRLDLERVAVNEEISFRRMGLTAADRVLVAVALDRCFMAGLAYFNGLVRLGATAIRGGSGSLPHLADLVRQHRPTAIIGVPSALLALGERLRAQGVEPATAGVKHLVCIGEPVRGGDLALSPLGRRLADMWRATVLGTYASTEMATAFSDCAAGCGGHLHPELAIVEILDAAGQPLPPGQAGEVVATPLGVTGMPLLRFRTGDIAVLHSEACPCGRLSPRMGPVLGRKAQMLKVRGTTIYPPAVYAALQELEAVCGYYLEAFDDFALSDRLRVTVALRDASLGSDAIAAQLAARLRVKPEVCIASAEAVTAQTLREGQRKPVLFFDHRNK